jgi:hypothetical protein
MKLLLLCILTFIQTLAAQNLKWEVALSGNLSFEDQVSTLDGSGGSAWRFDALTAGGVPIGQRLVWLTINGSKPLDQTFTRFDFVKVIRLTRTELAYQLTTYNNEGGIISNTVTRVKSSGMTITKPTELSEQFIRADYKGNPDTKGFLSSRKGEGQTVIRRYSN